MSSYYKADIVKSVMHFTSFNFCNEALTLGNILMSADAGLCSRELK